MGTVQCLESVNAPCVNDGTLNLSPLSCFTDESVTQDATIITLRPGTVQLGVHGTKFPPGFGYFEIFNASEHVEEYVAVKVVHDIPNTDWVVNRAYGLTGCSNMTVLSPQSSLYGFFNNTRDSVEVFVTWGRALTVGKQFMKAHGDVADVLLCHPWHSNLDQATKVIKANPLMVAWENVVHCTVKCRDKNCMMEFQGKGKVELLRKDFLTNMFGFVQKSKSGIDLGKNATHLRIDKGIV